MTIKAEVKVVRIRKGKVRLDGVTHTAPDYPGKVPCGGQIYAERVALGRRLLGPRSPDDDREFRWECYCDECQECDPNGWPTLNDCKAEAPGFWMGESD